MRKRRCVFAAAVSVLVVVLVLQFAFEVIWTTTRTDDGDIDVGNEDEYNMDGNPRDGNANTMKQDGNGWFSFLSLPIFPPKHQYIPLDTTAYADEIDVLLRPWEQGGVFPLYDQAVPLPSPSCIRRMETSREEGIPLSLLSSRPGDDSAGIIKIVIHGG